MLRIPVQRIFANSLRITIFRDCKDPSVCPKVLRCYSTQAVTKEDSNAAVTEKQTEETRIKKSRPLTNTPFIRELFLGRFAKETLVYPEMTKEELENLNQMVQPVEKFFNEALDSKSIDVNAKIPDEVLQSLKDLGLFGQQIPEEYGGLGLNATEFARLAEITALDGSIAVTLAAHQSIGLKGILIAGNDEQKAKYLPKLATGEHTAAFCLTEPSSGSDAASIQTRGTLSEDGKTFLLNGGKIWISNGGIADIFTVFAKTKVMVDGVEKDKVTAFIVERAFGGVTSGKPEDKLGIRGSNTCEVHFENTPVPLENVLGEVGGGFKVAMNILNSGRFSMGSSGAGILKKLIGMTCEHAVTRKQFGAPLSEFGLIQEKFAQMTITTYAMESMAYLTAGTLDLHEKPDVSLEAAIVKIFSSEGCWTCVNECLQILGGLGYMKDYPYERYLRDGRILMIFEGTNEILRLFVALEGMKYAGKELTQALKVLRNPWQNPGVAWKTFKKGLKQKLKKKPESKILIPQPQNSTLQLLLSLHNTLQIEAQNLEGCTLAFQNVVEHLLVTHGKDIVNAQMDLAKVANIVIDIYGMTACISRSNRSYCLGLQNADHEILLTKAFCKDAMKRIQTNITEIYDGPVKNNSENYEHIAQAVFKHGGYAAAHPLERMW
ncbi:complex I assembly factor ACAD9, mitochondrial-like isoform X2 [Saccostrea cucullata]|uniref:complex I assembly factor ACAD9, mitochondrial-like isoform X1 n=1 Tax=Saccostrea cuccullata TaxID=36930 RepID=UPI002ED4C225